MPSLEVGSLVCDPRVPEVVCRLTSILGPGLGVFHVVTKDGRRNRRWNGWSGPLHLYVPVCLECGRPMGAVSYRDEGEGGREKSHWFCVLCVQDGIPF